MKQTTKFVLCRSTPMCLTALVPPSGEEEVDAKRRLLGVAPRSYSGSIVPLRDTGRGSRIGHTVIRALRCVDPQRHPALAPSLARHLLVRRACYTERLAC